MDSCEGSQILLVDSDPQGDPKILILKQFIKSHFQKIDQYKSGLAIHLMKLFIGSIFRITFLTVPFVAPKLIILLTQIFF